MNSVAIVLTIGWLLTASASRLETPGVPAQTASSQQSSQPDAGPAPAAATPTPPAALHPCPTASPSTSAPLPDCKPVRKKHKAKTPPGDPSTGSSTRVVHNGSTGNLDVDITPGVSPQQASRQLETTNQLLAKTAENLKIVEARQLNAGQQDTVKQIKTYMDQSKAATKGGDVQRAYTLANKARMLSGDLVKH